MVIKIFIGHFTWLPDSPSVFVGTWHRSGRSENASVKLLKAVALRGRSRRAEPRLLKDSKVGAAG